MAVDNIRELIQKMKEKRIPLTKEDDNKIIKSFFLLRDYFRYLDEMQENAGDETENLMIYLLLVYSSNMDEAMERTEKLKKMLAMAEKETF